MRLLEEVDSHNSYIALVLNDLGEITLELGDLNKAQQYLARSLAVHEQFGRRDYYTALAHRNLGIVFRK